MRRQVITEKELKPVSYEEVKELKGNKKLEKELIDEIKCRIGMDGKLDYRTVDSE